MDAIGSETSDLALVRSLTSECRKHQTDLPSVNRLERTVAGRPSQISAKAAKKAAAKRVAAKASTPRKTAAKAQPKSSARKGAKPALLAGGNPQIAKADGDAPVRAYI